MFNSLSAEVKALSSKFGSSKTCGFFSHIYVLNSIKPSASVEILEPVAGEDVTTSVPEFIYDPKFFKV
ncbi:unnamed protein product [Hymenolepis diminuta]|uniref:Transferred entry: 5.6.2.1 n=1 Tax=Hymenolepis diminuta TaxID=6216 RepID=A0A0R3SHS8_HYMDI|nr:unnamed protein product [Hymenolepis diminuta]